MKRDGVMMCCGIGSDGDDPYPSPPPHALHRVTQGFQRPLGRRKEAGGMRDVQGERGSERGREEEERKDGIMKKQETLPRPVPLGLLHRLTPSCQAPGVLYLPPPHLTRPSRPSLYWAATPPTHQPKQTL
ncbi:hypothetical protein Pmani_013647 [Petrolisthes manimaculis]|uniref:Uncharacterized protein n=1 Tax=Petrolisthes manimaculis TaxID=1843537 RepID=A0AAE1U9E9_9EUCA|nr:hypothetical protein Pmani_013647 [Petrolisthes manimaculis]